MECYGRFAKLFVRFAVAVAAFLWISARLPLAGETLRRFAAVVASPLFVFLLCHVIVVSVIADSGKLSLRNRTNHQIDDQKIKSEFENDAVRGTETNDVVFEDKEVISETKIAAIEEEGEEEAPTPLRRWRSENFEREASESCDQRDRLRRSESEKCLETADLSDNVESRDELSDEDFNRTVEAFIAKQHKFRQQEHVSPDVSTLCTKLSSAING